MVGLAVLRENVWYAFICNYCKINKSIIKPNRFCLDKFQKYTFTTGCQVHKLVLTTLLVIQLVYLLVYNLTCWKEIALHSLPVVQEFREAVPSWAPTGAACIARQLSSAVPLEPSLNSNTQALNPYWFSDPSQKAEPSPPSGFLTQWPNEVRTLISCTLRKVSEYRTCLQANRLPLDSLTLSFPTL